MPGEYDYDCVVIGGGSGGLACSKEVAKLGKKVACLDFVKPTPIGTKWGLGGTCVNVGCIPKKLCHFASLLGEGIEDAKHYGWDLPEKKTHNWETLIGAIQDHIGSLNWGYRTTLRSANVKYINAFGTLVDAHTIECTDKSGKTSTITADKIVLAVGGRPKYMGLANEEELVISSDDIFSQQTAPGKTLVVGASYVALECAGFLAGLGYDTTVMVRSILLRGFDQDCANQIGAYMEAHGTKFIRGSVPCAIEKGTEKKAKVSWKLEDGTVVSDEFDTVLYAIGRDVCTPGLNLGNAGVNVNPRNGKIVTDELDKSSADNIFAIGDIREGGGELTPVAIKAGILLARRLYAGATQRMEYEWVPTTVFTPIEYGAVGTSEEDAIAKLGASNVEVFHSKFKPLEHTIAKRADNECYCKVICDKTDNMRILGLHILGIHAGEITQGYGLALKMGATKQQLDMLVGIHPTSAEEFTTLAVTKSSGESADKAGC